MSADSDNVPGMEQTRRVSFVARDLAPDVEEPYTGSGWHPEQPSPRPTEQSFQSNRLPGSDFARFRNLRSSSNVVSIDKSSGVQTGSSRVSSLELRRLPPEILLVGDIPDDGDSLYGEDSERDDKSTSSQKTRGVINNVCLNPQLELRTQLLLSFGTLSVLSISFVVITCILASIFMGTNVKDINQDTFNEINKRSQGRRARYLAESLDHRLFPRDASDILHEAVLDRFEDYPNDTEQRTPFPTEDGSNFYPVVGPELILDWNVSRDVRHDNFREHVQTRGDWFGDIPVTTKSAAFHTAGICDPAESNPAARTYFPDCSDANNDLSTGGVLNPSNLTAMLHRKGKDLVHFLKALYEYNQDMRDIGIYYANDGSGAYMGFPGFSLDGANSYTSVGCDWMKQPNPYDPSRTIGTQRMIDKCRPEGTEVFTRAYNPMERGWCMRQALNPFKTVFDGPFLDAFLEGAWLLLFGRSVYHRATREFIACIAISLRVEFLEEIMRESRVYPNSEVTMVRLDQGAVVASSAWNITEKGAPPPIHELGIGITTESFETFKSLVNFDSEWEPKEARAAYENHLIETDGLFLVSYPFPPVPSEYDKDYQPEFLTIMVTPFSDVFETVDHTNDNVDDRVTDIVVFSTIMGCGAIVLLGIVLLVMSDAITSPLRFMNDVAKRIVNSFGDDSPDAKNFADYAQKKSCFDVSPETEVTQVVREFKKMVSSFSGGSLMARSEAAKQVEVASHFPMRAVFADLYQSRSGDSASDSLNCPAAGALEEPIHLGSNLVVHSNFEENIAEKKIGAVADRRLSSPLLLWTVILIVIPLLLTMMAIGIVSMTAMEQEFRDTIHESEEFLLSVEIRDLEVSTGMRAAFASQQIGRCIRDLYLMTRYAAWLLFSAVELPNEIPAFQNVIDECKVYDDPDDCPEALAYKVCDCSWNELPEECPTYIAYPHLPYAVVMSDSAHANGTRWGSAFPSERASPETTQWWRNAELPGRTNTSTFSHVRYSTSFDRARVITATSPVLAALDRYTLRTDHGIAQYFAFHDDGMFVGGESCTSYRHPSYVAFRSTEDNGAAEISPELCPLGSYGYDPRCRDWYDSGKRAGYDNGIPLHVTAPYVFSDGVVALSASSHLVDPRNGHYVGQALYDFSVDVIVKALDFNNTPTKGGGFPLLITTSVDNFGGDCVIGPGHTANDPARPIIESVMPADIYCAEAGDENCLGRKAEFEEIIASMKACATGTASFTRLTKSGDVELLYISYAPVTTRFLTPADSSDFARGAELWESCVYSFALVETATGLQEPFSDVEEELHDQIRIAIGCLSGVIFLAVVLALVVSRRVARSITEPIGYLLEVIRSVQRKGVDQELPRLDMKRGSKEILNVSHTMETLYEVVRFANVAFYAGELEVAYRVLRDSLRVFRGMDNKKAISVACNNLGNILLVMYLDMKHDEVHVKFGLTRKELITLGTAFYHEAIKLGEAAYDAFYNTEGWTPNCLDFMQHLSNRYFNRAIFLLSIKDDHEQPSEIERLGLRDLKISRDMDVEIVDQGEEVGWGRTNREEKIFQVGLTRVRGLLLLLDLGYPDDWFIQDRLDVLTSLLAAESEKPNSSLFEVISYTGRLQQLETEMMKYKMAQNEIDAASKIAIRSLYEDEYLLAETKAEAIQVLMQYVQLNADKWDGTVRQALKKWLEDSMDSLSMGVNSERQTSVSDAFLSVLSKSMRGGESSSLSIKQKTLRYSINEHSCVTMEKF